jgi:hypothetical protein
VAACGVKEPEPVKSTVPTEPPLAGLTPAGGALNIRSAAPALPGSLLYPTTTFSPSSTLLS